MAAGAGAVSLWRITKHTLLFDADDLSGGGAKLRGGRWNSQGRAALYASGSIALATLETLAHMNSSIRVRDLFLVELTVPASLWRARIVVTAGQLAPTWCATPPGSTTRRVGDDWLDGGQSALLLVPSVIVPEEYNVVINPAHRHAARIGARVARQFVYDPRLS
jgi:RES domain-containing protein